MNQFVSLDQVAGFKGVILDCRFSLMDGEEGARLYGEGHIPGAQFLDLNRDMSAAVAEHGGRHPLPAPAVFAKTLADLGIAKDTPTLIYDDSRYAFAARCWWMMRALGYQSPLLISGGYAAWLANGGTPQTARDDVPSKAEEAVPAHWPLCCDKAQLAELQRGGARLIDAREGARYRGEHEPIDPVAGHIPGAENRPWQGFSSEEGQFVSTDAIRAIWGDLAQADTLIAYCGSGVSACVAILSLAQIGREDVWLYGGSWSDWCSYL